MENYGLSKTMITLRIFCIQKILIQNVMKELVEYAKRKGGFRVDKLNVKDIVGEAKAIKKILDNSVPDHWDYLAVPSLKAVIDEFKSLVQF